MITREFKELLNLSTEQEDAFDSLVNRSDTSEISIDDVQEAIDMDIGEAADSACDVYTASLLKWYLNDLNRMGYADDAIKELGGEDLAHILMGGQYLYYNEIMGELQDILKDKISGIETLDELITPVEPEVVESGKGKEWEKRWMRRSGVINEMTVEAKEVLI